MSGQHHDFPETTVSQVLLALLGGLLAPLLVFFLLFKLIMGIQATHVADSDAAVATAKVTERIQPVGESRLAEAVTGPRVHKSGEEVVKAACAACHAVGAMGAPKIGDKGAWGPRLSQGYATLVKHAIQGIRMMPARGGNPDLSDTEVARAVAHMANATGASFKAPEPPAEAPAENPGPAADAAAKAAR